MVTDEPFDLAAFAPAECPHGHILRYGGREDAAFIPGRVLCGFHSCACATARKDAGSFGHQYVCCLRCVAEGRGDGMMYEPPCSETG